MQSVHDAGWLFFFFLLEEFLTVLLVLYTAKACGLPLVSEFMLGGDRMVEQGCSPSYLCVLCRLILVLGCIFFFTVCAYIVYARVPLLQRAVSFFLSPLAALLPWRTKGLPQAGDYRMDPVGGESFVHKATTKTCIAGQCF